MRILAIDPGYERVGVAILEKRFSGPKREEVLHSECFKTSAEIPHQDRLKLIGEKIKQEIEKWSPKRLAIETLFFNKNHKTAMAVSEARGVIIFQAVSADLEIFQYSPLQVKIAVTGYGRADKDQIVAMVKALTKLEKKEAQDDEFDAIAIGLTCLAIEK